MEGGREGVGILLFSEVILFEFNVSTILSPIVASLNFIPQRYCFYLSYASLLHKYVSISIMTLKQQAYMLSSCSLNSCFFGRNVKGLLNFVSDRIKLAYNLFKLSLFHTLFYRINVPSTAFKTIGCHSNF